MMMIILQCLYGNVPFHAGGQEGTEAPPVILNPKP